MLGSNKLTTSGRCSVCPSQRGFVLPTVLMLLVILAAMGTAGIWTTRAEMKVGHNYENSQQAFFVAQGGSEHAREVLRASNAASIDRASFSEELATAAGPNGVLDGYVGGTDDVPLISTSDYTVYMINDSTDGFFSQTDTNRTVTFTSIGTGPNGTTAVIELTVETWSLFPPPGAITLVGPGAQFIGNNSNAKEIHGDDQCATDPIVTMRPAVAISHLADLPAVQASIAGSKPDTYSTEDETGVQVTASTRPDLISQIIPGSTYAYFMNTWGVNLLDADSVNEYVDDIRAVANTVAAGGTDAATVNVGTVADPQVVVVNGDFHLNFNGAGILVVTGELVYQGDIFYDGMVLVLGEGSMRRNGAGDGKISGGIVVVNTAGPDGIVGTADDALGTPTMDTAGGGNSNIEYCSTAFDNAYTAVPPRAKAFNHLM
ncbi:MAG: hypothetical protein GTO40_17105 [Deltaproteobacteria bacterium]|nr:hypothetical protein [Deltaproteobacteria bacterium]